MLRAGVQHAAGFLNKKAAAGPGDGQPFRRKRIFRFMIRWLCPVFAAVILASSVANAFGIIKM